MGAHRRQTHPYGLGEEVGHEGLDPRGQRQPRHLLLPAAQLAADPQAAQQLERGDTTADPRHVDHAARGHEQALVVVAPRQGRHVGLPRENKRISRDVDATTPCRRQIKTMT